jgi:hypothetical protein
MDWEASKIFFPQNLGMCGLCQTFDVRQAHSKIRQIFHCGGIRGKPKDIIFIIKPRAKCLSLTMVSSWRRETKGYYFYNKAEGKVFVAHNGVFMEKKFLSKGISGSKVQLEEIQETPKNISAPTDTIQVVQGVVPPDVEALAPRRSIRACRATEKFTLLTME